MIARASRILTVAVAVLFLTVFIYLTANAVVSVDGRGNSLEIPQCRFCGRPMNPEPYTDFREWRCWHCEGPTEKTPPP